MAIVMAVLSNSQMLNESDFNINALLQFGDGGVGVAQDYPETPEYQLDSLNGDSDPAYGIWDTNYVNGITSGVDSGWVGVSFSANAATGAESLYVGIGDGGANNAPTTYTDTPLGSIGEVDIITGTNTQAAFKWENLTITFSENGQPVATWTDSSTGGGADVSVDQTGSSSPTLVQAGISVQPGVAANSMTLTGSVRLIATANADLTNPQAMFSQIFVKPA